MDDKEVLLTQEGYDKLEAELESLRTEKSQFWIFLFQINDYCILI